MSIGNAFQRWDSPYPPQIYGRFFDCDMPPLRKMRRILLFSSQSHTYHPIEYIPEGLAVCGCVPLINFGGSPAAPSGCGPIGCDWSIVSGSVVREPPRCRPRRGLRAARRAVAGVHGLSIGQA